MTLYELWSHFDFCWQKAMRGTNHSQNAYQKWLKMGCIPLNAQAKIQRATKGDLVARVDEDLVDLPDERLRDKPREALKAMRYFDAIENKED